MNSVCRIIFPCLASVAVSAYCSPVNAAEWLGFRGNATLDGHSSAKGAIAEPEVVWSYFAGGFDAFAIAESGETGTGLALPGNGDTEVSADAFATCWGLSPSPGDIEGREQAISNTSSTVYADIIRDVPGMEKVEFESGFAKPTVNNQWQPCVGRCFAWREGKWERAWETEPFELLFIALPLAGDFDGDRQLEIAFLPWHELVLLDAQTGKVKDRCKFTEGRSYGFLGAYDLNGDGSSEFVVQADFCKHIDVLGFREGKLALLWSKAIEPDISNPQKVLRVNPDPVADIDGDGNLEVLENLWDGTADGRWHIYAHDGLTGTVRADLPDEYLQGVFDVNGDDVAELLTAASSGAGVPQFGPSRVYSLKGGLPGKLWESSDAGWQTWEPPFRLNVNSSATLARQTALCRTFGGPALAVLRKAGAGGQTTVSLARWSTDGFERVLAATGPSLKALAVDPDSRVLLNSYIAPGEPVEVTLEQGHGRYIGSRRQGISPSTPVIVKGPDGKSLVIVQGGNENLLALRPSISPSTATDKEIYSTSAPAWEIKGRAQGDNWPTTYGPVVANLQADGNRQLLYATASDTGCGRLVAADLNTRELWHCDFPDIPGTAPVWNTGGIVFWQPGHFTDPDTEDILVTVRRSMMHSEETALLSGKDGSLLWRRNRQVSARGVGGMPFAIDDFDGDELDDAASFYPSIFYILKGTTGADLIARDAAWDNVPAKPVYWGKAVAGHFSGSGARADVFMAGAALTGLVRADGTLVWSDALEQSAKTFAFGDFDADGQIEAIGVEYPNGLRCYDAAAGVVEWRMANVMSGTAAGAASADINADGSDEAIFCSGTSVYCYAVKNGSGVLAWEVTLPATLGPPALGDIDGSGNASIVVSSAEGYVYAIQ